MSENLLNVTHKTKVTDMTTLTKQKRLHECEEIGANKTHFKEYLQIDGHRLPGTETKVLSVHLAIVHEQ